MLIRIKNLTYQPIRLITKKGEVRIPPRKSQLFEEYTDQMKLIEKRGLIRIKKLK